MSRTQARGPRMLSMLAAAAASEARPRARCRKVIELGVALLLEMHRDAPRIRIRVEPSAAHAEPAGLAHAVTLIGSGSGVWSIPRMDVR